MCSCLKKKSIQPIKEPEGPPPILLEPKKILR